MKRPKYHHVGVRAGRVMRLVTLPTQAAQRDRRALVRVPRLCASSRPFVDPYQSLHIAPRRTSFRPRPECEQTARRLTLMGPDWMRMGRVVIAPGVEEGDIVVFVVGGERVDAEVCNPNGGVVQKGTSGRATCFLYEAPQTPPDMHPNGSRAPASGKPFLQCPRMEGAGAARWGARLTRPIAVFPLFRTLSGLPTTWWPLVSFSSTQGPLSSPGMSSGLPTSQNQARIYHIFSPEDLSKPSSPRHASAACVEVPSLRGQVVSSCSLCIQSDDLLDYRGGNCHF